MYLNFATNSYFFKMLSNDNDDDEDEGEEELEKEKENWYRVYTDNKKVSVPDANL